MSAVDTLWYGGGIAPRLARGALLPASLLYEAGARLRDWRYSNQSGAVVEPVIPAVSLGNLTVGGTGKTPLAAWAASSLRERGGKPAILMRGYGDDEPLVHARLNPDVPVIADADRIRGAMRARELGADCAILDDGFQHRRIARVSDWVLVAAERWRDDLRMLPAGPLREPASALARADVLVITRKSASLAEAKELGARLGARFHQLGVAVCHLAPQAVIDARTGAQLPLAWLAGKRMTASAAVAAPDAFVAQVRAAGAEIDELPFGDHHAFSDADVHSLVAAAGRGDGLICTLKDAVKLAPRWPPAAAPLWYVSQIATIERGEALLARALEAVLAARQGASSTAGNAGPSFPLNGHRSSTAD
jgi:tetraacyldisaccharide 4'-kinase